MVKSLDRVYKCGTSSACLSNGRDMPIIGGLAINVLSRQFRLKCVVNVRKVAAMCFVVDLWCKGNLGFKQETRQGAARLERGVPLVFATQGYYFGKETHCQFPELTADVCSISGVLTEIVSQKEQFFFWGRFNENIEATRT
jgi:hypothetical protein